jgi:hypothetical protein
MAFYYAPLNFDPDSIFRGESSRTYAFHDFVVSDDPDYDGIALNADELAYINNHYDFSSITVDDLIAGHTDDAAIAASAAEIFAIINTPVSDRDGSHYIASGFDASIAINGIAPEDAYEGDTDDDFTATADVILVGDGDGDDLDGTGTPSIFSRLAAHSDYYVRDGNAWGAGDFDPAHFATHCATTSRARRYHGIDDIVFDEAGRIRGRGLKADGSPRRRRRASRRVGN